ncbi:MAG: ADP-ribosylglycohydrolase family protein, partial [Planctomycetota bacterium]|nr:ADP-ribosylglycohydrolase family protein [Planctomycetota bacterium]
PAVLIGDGDRFTDDTVLTYAVAMGLLSGMGKIRREDLSPNPANGGEAAGDAVNAARGTLEREIALSVKKFARAYPHAGYGGSFARWFSSDSLEPYNSWGNGSAMRVSFAGWYADSLAEARLLANLSAKITHNHPHGLKGAEVVAECIYRLRSGEGKEAIRQCAGRRYDMNFTLDAIRPTYGFDVSCEGSVPQAIMAFLEGGDFEDVIKLAISIGGDSDTIAAIAGSLAEAFYEIPPDPRERALAKLDRNLLETVQFVSAALAGRRL